MNCGTCKYFLANGKFGMCHRFPEGVMKQDTQWCGEHHFATKDIPVYTPETLPETQKRRGRPPKNDQTSA